LKVYKLKFLPIALKEWDKLNSSLKQQFKKKLEERLKQPKVASARLIGFNDVYKIKLRSMLNVPVQLSFLKDNFLFSCFYSSLKLNVPTRK
jgi:hypothetical protein